MKPSLKASGIFYGSIFFAAAIFNFADDIVKDKLPPLSAILDIRYVLSLLVIGGLMFASAYVARIAWLQPAIFLATIPLTILGEPRSIYGLGFFAVAVLLLFKLGFYEKRRILKTIASVSYLLALEVIAALQNGDRLYIGLMPTFFILAFMAFLFLTFRDRIVVYLKEPKERLSLDSKGLADSEQLYLHAVLKGKSVKQVGFEFGVNESTVRNTLARAYKKLGVKSKTDVSALAQKFDLV